MPNTIKTLTLKLDNDNVECQLTRAALIDNPTTEDLVTFCGTESSSIKKYSLEISGFQDYGQAESVFDMLHTAYKADPVAEIDFILHVGGHSRAGSCKPVNDPPFGGDAGAALTADITLEVVGDVLDATVVNP